MIRAGLTGAAMRFATAWLALAPAALRAQTIESVRAERSAFEVRFSDGRVLGSRDLVGAVLQVETGGERLAIRIDAVSPDPRDPEKEILLHALSIRNEDGSFEPYCAPDAQGVRAGFPLAGRALADGRFVDDPERFELTCTSGALGKCARFGYAPWRSKDGRSLRAHFEACLRMVRADYCGEGTAHTRDGTEIDLYDDLGLQTPANEPGFRFEAGWSPEGAVCVAHTRVPEELTLERLEASCPRLRGRTGAVCSESAARERGARLFDASR